MKHDDDCPECAAFIAEMKAAIGKRPPMSTEQRQQAVERYLTLPDEAIARLQESFALTKAARVYARFIGTSHPHRLR